MIYTDSGKYAIRAMTYLASRPADQLPISASDVAEAEGIPPFYLAKVLQDLARDGILASVRGRGGGFLLKRAPEEIHVLEVLQAVENIARLTTECVLGLDECNDTVSCPLHSIWKKFRESLLDRLADMTVADLVIEQKRKRRYLKSRKSSTAASSEARVNADTSKASG
ncbi:MAG: RrF2 family transcriptional regulator [Acidobacteriota bacterium]